jgi:hypothetical protein
MAERKFFYFKQPVANTELNAAFDGLENAIFDLVVDYGLSGIVKNLVPIQHGGGNLTVDVTAGIAYDQLGERIDVPTTQNLNCAQDYLSTNTAVASAGHTKILSVFVEFQRTLSDPRTDGNSATVYFEQAESFKLNVFQGTESAGTPTPPTLQSTQILLADITLSFGQTAIITSNISFARSQYAPVLGTTTAGNVTANAYTGVRFNVSAGTLQSQLTAMDTAFDTLKTTGVDCLTLTSNVGSLRALGAPVAVFGINVCIVHPTVASGGIFVYDTTSTAADDGIMVVKPTGVSGAGRWRAVYSPAFGQALGIPQLDSGAQLAAGTVHKAQRDLQSMTIATGTTTVSTTTLTDITNGPLEVTFSGCNIGDKLDIYAQINAQGTGSFGGVADVLISENGGGFSNVGQIIATGTPSSSVPGVQYAGRLIYSVTTGNAVVVKIQVAGSSGGGTIEVFSGSTLIASRIAA